MWLLKSNKRGTVLPIAGLVFAVCCAEAQSGAGQAGSETIARPKNPSHQPAADADSSSGRIPSKLSPKNQQGAESDPSFTAEAETVTLDVAVLDNQGNPVPQIPKGNFRILEDNIPQKITHYATTEAPLTIALVVEFSNRFQSFWSEGWYETLVAVQSFAQVLRPNDYVAIIAYDLRSEILCDFTDNPAKISEAMQRLQIPGFSESNMFDALTDTADRMSKIEGRKAIVLISSGIDTFSHITYDKTRKLLQDYGVPVYSVEILQLMRQMMEAQGMLGGPRDLSFLQGDNELRTFAKETGGQAYFPRFLQEMPADFAGLTHTLRSQYTLGYSPTNRARDGKFRKLTVQLVNPESNEPLRMVDAKGKPIKYSILAKSGYSAPRAVE